MTEETEEPGPVKPPKRSIRELLITIAAPQRFETEGLGSIWVRRPTGNSEQAFARRVEDPSRATDADLVRIYLGCVSGLPAQDADESYEPLTEEDVSKLTPSDIDGLAVFYLEKIAEVTPGIDPVRTFAELIRNQTETNNAAMAAMFGSKKDHMKEIRDGSAVLKSWAELQKTYGDVNSLQSQVDKLLGPSASMQDIINKALANPIDEVRNLTGSFAQRALDDQLRSFTLPQDKYQSILAGVGKDHARSAIEDAMRDVGRIGATIDPPDYHARFPLQISMHETPAGRAAQASEDLVEAAEQIKDSIGGILKQVGLVTEHVAEVSETIRKQAKSFLEEGGRQNAQTRRFALIANGLAAAALILSAVVAVVGYYKDRSDSEARKFDTELGIRAIKEQNELMKNLAQPQAPFPSSKPVMSAAPAPKPASPPTPAPDKGKTP